MKKDIIPLIIIFLIATIISLPLLAPGFYTVHDDQQIARLYLFDKALFAGQFPVRWVDELGFGFGYPLFVFYPPFVYMLAESFKLLGFGYVGAIKMVFALSIFISGISMYILAKQFSGKLGGLTSSLFYILAPYRAIDIYIRGALSESFSFVWLPIILLALYKIQTNKNYMYLAALSLAFLMITHNLVFLPFSFILFIYIFLIFYITKNKKRYLFLVFISALLSAALSAFFWLPALTEKHFTIVDQILLADLANYKIHFVNPIQLWDSPWGYAGSAEGLADGISFKIGKLHILISIAALSFSILLLIKNRVNKKIYLSVLFFGLFLFSSFMTTQYSYFIWQNIGILAYLQFPWRFLIFTSLFSSILAGIFIYNLKIPIIKLAMFIILVLLLLTTNVKLFKPQTYRKDLTDEKATQGNLIKWNVSKTSFEYVPKGVQLYRGELGTNQIDIKKSELPNNKVEVLSGKVNINNLTIKPHLITFNTQSSEMSKIQINAYNFPGWKAIIDNNQAVIYDDNKLKLINLFIPAGIHSIEIKFTNTPLRTLANLITLSAIMLISAKIFKKWIKI